MGNNRKLKCDVNNLTDDELLCQCNLDDFISEMAFLKPTQNCITAVEGLKWQLFKKEKKRTKN